MKSRLHPIGMVSPTLALTLAFTAAIAPPARAADRDASAAPPPAATSPAATSPTATSPAAASPAATSLYQRLGAETGVREIVMETLRAVSTDPRTRRTFDKVDMRRLQGKIVEHICALTAGGCTYSGDNMKQSHAGMNITEAEFYLMVEALRQALDRHVGEREKNELLKILAPMKRDIVGG